jgi:DNA-binding transcriptional LysR family regulator
MTIQTDDIACFMAVVREGSFGRAASSLLVSQPAVSERIARLEREAGASLFQRSARGTTLTPAGESLVPYAQRTLELLDDAVTTIRSLDEAPRFRVAVHTTFAHRAIDLVLRSLSPPLRRSIKLRDAHTDMIIAMLMDGACDIGFIVPATRPRSLRFVALPADPVVAVVAPSHPLAGRSAHMTDLAEHRIAFNRFGTGATAFVERLHKAQVPEWRWTECSDAVTALHLAADHGHVAMVTKSLADSHIGAAVVALRLSPVPRWTMPLMLAYRQGDHDEPAIAAVRTTMEALGRPRRPAR